jgi:hypothetical protein
MNRAKAIEFMNSMRGQYIMSQALTVAIDTMKQVEPPHTEFSNIADMEYLRDEIFPIFKAVEAITSKAK